MVRGEVLVWKKDPTTGKGAPFQGNYSIEKKKSPSHPAWTWLRIFQGAFLRGEVVLIDHRKVHLSTLSTLLNQPFWSFCSGIDRTEYRITKEDLRAILVPLIEDALRKGDCHRCQAEDAVLAEDPFLLRTGDRYEYQYWCAPCHSERDRQQLPA